MDQGQHFLEAMRRMLAGSRDAEHDFFRIVQGDLEAIAREVLAVAGADLAVEPEQLVAEAFLRLRSIREVRGRDAYGQLARSAMRSILAAHRRMDASRGSGNPFGFEQATQKALRRLHELVPEGSRLVYLKTMLGYTIEEAAAELGIGLRTAQRRWSTVRSFLQRELDRGAEES